MSASFTEVAMMQGFCCLEPSPDAIELPAINPCASPNWAKQIDSITSGVPGDAIPDDREVTGPVSKTPGPTSKPK
jgi:hypothetical protein